MNTQFSRRRQTSSFSQVKGCACRLVENTGYDYMGRRCIKKITVNGVITLHQRYLYRGYLQIACVDLTRSGHPGLWLITWDPTQPTATRPLAIQKNGTWYTYGHDLTKNVTELYNTNGTIATAYDYTPFGQVTASGTADQPIQWSSEYNDTELGLIYYNYRHYNPKDGRWINRDPIAEQGGWNLYGFVRNAPISRIDYLGFCWSNQRAFLHYLNNNGANIDLDQTGCTAEVTKSIQSEMDAWSKKAEEDAKKLMNELTYSDGPKILEKSGVKGVKTSIFWIGGISLYERYQCIVTCRMYACGTGFFMADKFVRPFDWDNSGNDIWDRAEAGTPFFVVHGWVGKGMSGKK